MRIRLATADDAAGLARLYDRVWSRETAALGQRLAAERRAQAHVIREWIEQDAYYVLEKTGAIAGVIGCEARHGTMHLVHLAVDPEHRRRGFGRALLARAEDHAREIGAVKIWFDTAPGLDAARQLYESLGYDRCGYLRRHLWGTDIELYEKLL